MLTGNDKNSEMGIFIDLFIELCQNRNIEKAGAIYDPEKRISTEVMVLER
jgi:hypothetical protein